MQAIEFVTMAEDGTIRIPKQHRAALKNKLRVIILIEEELTPKVAKTAKGVIKKKFVALKLDTKKIKFDRDEANKR